MADYQQPYIYTPPPALQVTTPLATQATAAGHSLPCHFIPRHSRPDASRVLVGQACPHSILFKENNIECDHVL